jgi:hypothetical protein
VITSAGVSRCRPNSAGQRRETLERNIAPYLYDVCLVAECVCRKRRLPEEIAVYAFAVLGQRGGPVGSCAGKIIAEELMAIDRSIVLAARAMTATVKGHENVVADGDLRDKLSHALDDAGTFMAEHDRLRNGIGLIAHRDVGVADSRRDQAHQYFVVARLFDRQSLNRHGGLGRSCHRCLYFHGMLRVGLLCGLVCNRSVSSWRYRDRCRTDRSLRASLFASLRWANG